MLVPDGGVSVSMGIGRGRSGEPVTFVVIDDDPAIRHLVTVQSQATPELRLVGRADDGATGIGLVATLQPDVILLDLVMPTSGLAVLPALRQVAPRSALLTWSVDPRALTRSRALGADDSVAKDRCWADVAERMVRLARREVATDTPMAVTSAAELRHDDVRLLGATPLTAPVAQDASWYCPACADRRPLVGAWSLEVEERGSDASPRRVLVCAVCAESFGVTPMPASG